LRGSKQEPHAKIDVRAAAAGAVSAPVHVALMIKAVHTLQIERIHHSACDCSGWRGAGRWFCPRTADGRVI